MDMTMIYQSMRLCSIFVISYLLLCSIGLAAAEDIVNNDDILNTAFGQHIGLVADINAQGQEGIFIYRSLGEQPIVSMLREDVETAAFELTGRYLVAYDASGQALYELPNDQYQMQITTPNGAINMSYSSYGTNLRGTDAMVETADILLQQTSDGIYSIYLLGTGELSVVMGPDVNDMTYQITFTGVPALNVTLSTVASDID
jgi:hypothetical protein